MEQNVEIWIRARTDEFNTGIRQVEQELGNMIVQINQAIEQAGGQSASLWQAPVEKAATDMVKQFSQAGQNAAQEVAQAIAGGHYIVNVGSDVSQIEQQLAGLASEIGAKSIDLTVTASNANTTLDGLTQSIQQLPDEQKIDVNIDAAKNNIHALEGEVDSLSGITTTSQHMVQSNTDEVAGEIAGLSTIATASQHQVGSNVGEVSNSVMALDGVTTYSTHVVQYVEQHHSGGVAGLGIAADEVLAVLQKGEYVVNRGGSAEFMPWLQLINHTPDRARTFLPTLPRFHGGGEVDWVGNNDWFIQAPRFVEPLRDSGLQGMSERIANGIREGLQEVTHAIIAEHFFTGGEVQPAAASNMLANLSSGWEEPEINHNLTVRMGKKRMAGDPENEVASVTPVPERMVEIRLRDGAGGRAVRLQGDEGSSERLVAMLRRVGLSRMS